MAGAWLERLGRAATTSARFVPGSLCAEVDGFSLHAGVWVAANDRERLEHLCRYVARPPFAAQRLKWSRHGRILYELRKRVPFETTHRVVSIPLRGTGAYRRDGTTHMVFEPEELLARLAALVPPPRMHQMG